MILTEPKKSCPQAIAFELTPKSQRSIGNPSGCCPSRTSHKCCARPVLRKRPTCSVPHSIWAPQNCPKSSSWPLCTGSPMLRKMLELFSSRISADQDLSVIVAEINNDDDVKQRLVSIVFHASVTQQRGSGSKTRISCSLVHERTNSCPTLANKGLRKRETSNYVCVQTKKGERHNC